MPQAIQVELRLFPDSENPRWVLDPKQERDFLERFKPLLDAKSLAQPLDAGYVAADMPPELGYTGFEVTFPDGSTVDIYHDALVDGFGLREGSRESIDRFLFSTNRNVLLDLYGLDEHALDPQPPQLIHGLPPTCPPERLRCEIQYPGPGSPWDRKFKSSTKCYDYANNLMTDFPASPGGDAFKAVTQWDEKTLHDALDRDLVKFKGKTLPASDSMDGKAQYIAACLTTWGKRGGYHFLRLDSNGCWSHKNGPMRVTNRAANKLIEDLCRAEPPMPLTFIGFFKTNDDARALIKKRLPGPPPPPPPPHIGPDRHR